MSIIRAATVCCDKKSLHDSEIEIQRAGDNVHTDQKNKRWGKKKKKTHHEVLHFLTRGECVADCYACRHTPTVSAAVGMGVV